MNHTEAVRWFQRAAAEGHVQAQEALAAALLYGLGIERSRSQAFAWLQRAAASGAPTAQHQLALLYASGDGGQRDVVSALEWLYTAAARSSRQRRQSYQTAADDIAKQASPDEVAEAHRRADVRVATFDEHP
jgi:TPR repeat protein